MAAKNRIIIDTDPGCDDVLAMLLAFAAKPEELEVLMVSLTFGNIDLQCTIRNVMSLLSIIEKEQAWRAQRGKPESFGALRAHKPVVAMGAEQPLADQLIMADYFHGVDGLGGIHTSHPHLSPSDFWRDLFGLDTKKDSVDKLPPSDVQLTADSHHSFTPSTVPAHKLILRMLAENPADTITIVAIGPMTNLALAAHEDTETFLRVKEVVVMGGAIDIPGNITPLAEFNTHADTIACARVLALTSKHPRSTMPPWPPSSTPDTHLPPYPPHLSKRLNLTLAPLDITTPHVLTEHAFTAKVKALGLDAAEKGSPLVEWMGAFLAPAWKKTKSAGGLSLHDPLAVFYAFHRSLNTGSWRVKHDEDMRVETMGQWTRGACIVDRRGWPRGEGSDDIDEEKASDRGGWRDTRKGNAVSRIVGSPFWGEEQAGKLDEKFANLLLDTVCGVSEQ